MVLFVVYSYMEASRVLVQSTLRVHTPHLYSAIFLCERTRIFIALKPYINNSLNVFTNTWYTRDIHESQYMYLGGLQSAKLHSKSQHSQLLLVQSFLLLHIRLTEMSAHKQHGGYDCDPVDPKTAASYMCGFCQKILRDPVQVQCCSSYYCHSCSEKHFQKPCPSCGKQLSTKYHPSRMYYSKPGASNYPYSNRHFPSGYESEVAYCIDQLQVYCSNKAKGCKWTGALIHLSKHLNIDPSTENVTNGCKYSNVKCPHCLTKYSRSKIGVHVKDTCSQRPYTCEYCNVYENSYEEVTQVHMKACDYRPVECPNKCGDTIPFCKIVDHCDNVCLNAITSCEYYLCSESLPRKAIPAHVLTKHIRELQADTDIGYELEEIRCGIQALRNELSQMSLVQTSVITSPPVQFKMYNFDGLKASETEWFSESFFTHPKGYKMCLNIDANGYGDGKNSHISVFAYLMQGEFDSDLKWPFQGYIVVQLLDQEGEDDHEETIHFRKTAAESSAGRVVGKERANGAQGIHKFITHADLKPKYLKDGCLHFRVVSATIFSL